MRQLLAIVLPALVTTSGSAEDWPQFRGPNCSGISVSSASLPVEFSESHNVRWSVDLGDGIGCPVVAAGRVFTSAMLDKDTVGLFAFDAASGKQLWKRTWPAGNLPDIHEANSHASSTPAADAKHVYFYFSTLGMMALDAQDGHDVWHCPLPEPYFVFKWGPAMSPVLYRNLLLFVQDDDLSPALYAIDRRTGKVRWKDDRSDMAVNYSHPVICETDRGDEIVVGGTGLLIGYDPKNGRRLWQARTLLRNIKTTPVVHDGIIYVSLQSSGIANQWLRAADVVDTGNADGKLTKAEMQAFVGERTIPEAFFRKTFDRGDVNHDGVLAGEELDKAFLHPENFAGAPFSAGKPAEQFILAVRGGGRGDVTDSHLVWKHPTRHTDHVVSPLVVDQRMLLIKGGGIATCFDTAAGKSIFGPGRIRNESDYLASPVYGDGKIYAAGENGRVAVLRNAPELDVLAVNDVGSPVVGTPAIADGVLYLRTRSNLLAVADGGSTN